MTPLTETVWVKDLFFVCLLKLWGSFVLQSSCIKKRFKPTFKGHMVSEEELWPRRVSQVKSSGFGNKKKEEFFKISHSCEILRKIRLVSFVNKHIRLWTLDFFSKCEADLQNCQTCRGVTTIFSLASDTTDHRQNLEGQLQQKYLMAWVNIVPDAAITFTSRRMKALLETTC